MSVANYYNYSTKQHVSTLLGYHQVYKTVDLVKVHFVVFTYRIPFGGFCIWDPI